MAISPASRSPVARSLDRLLVTAGLTLLGVGMVEILVFVAGDEGPLWILVEFVVAGWIYVGAGLVAWHRRPSNGMGTVLVCGGLAWLVANLDSVAISLVHAAGAIVATVPLAVVVHLVHAFPSGRLTSTASRITVLAGYGVSVVLQAPSYLFDVQPAPFDALLVADRPALAAAGSHLQSVAGAIVVMATAVILINRVRDASATQRRVLAPLYAYGVLAVLMVPLLSDVIGPLLHIGQVYVGALQVLELAGIPVAFALGVLRGGFARTGEIVELGALLGAPVAAGTAVPGSPLSAALARTLGDPSLELVYWVPTRGTYVDDQGGEVDLPVDRGTSRAAVEVTVAGRLVGAIVYDATLIADRELVDAAGRVAAIAVDRERLIADLLASEEALRQSRGRIVEAADRERGRIAANLHDGLQVQLVLLGIEAQDLASRQDAHHEALTALRMRIDDAAAQLRELVHAVMPAALVERGLSAAAEDLVDRMPVPTRLTLLGIDRALPTAVQSTAYFVVAEGLANALKYAHAEALTVRLTRVESRLEIEVRDDGVGGAVDAGRGLRGIADRVDVLGGRFSVHSTPGRGTQLIAELPCES